MVGGDLTQTSRSAQLDLLGAIAGDAAAPKRAAKDGGAVIKVDHRDLHPAADNRPSGMDADGIAGLAANIFAIGLKTPLLVRETGTGTFGTKTYRIVAGARRHAAIGLLIASGRWPCDRRIACIAVKTDDFGEAIARLSENLQREDMNPLDECEAVVAACTLLEDAGDDEYAGTAKERVAQLLGMTLRWVQQRCRIAETLGALDKARLRAGEITITQAREMVTEARAVKAEEPPDEEGAALPPQPQASDAAGAGERRSSAAVPLDPPNKSADDEEDKAGDDVQTSAEDIGERRSSAGVPLDPPNTSADDEEGAAREAPSPVTRTVIERAPRAHPDRVVKAMTLDIVPVQAAYDAGDVFPTGICFADPRNGVMQDYVRVERAEHTDELLARAARALAGRPAPAGARIDVGALLVELHDFLGWEPPRVAAEDNDPAHEPAADAEFGTPAAEVGAEAERGGAFSPGGTPRPAPPDSGWPIYDTMGDHAGDAWSPGEFARELRVTHVHDCRSPGELKSLWAFNEKMLTALPGETAAAVAKAFNRRKQELGGVVGTIDQDLPRDDGAEASRGPTMAAASTNDERVSEIEPGPVPGAASCDDGAAGASPPLPVAPLDPRVGPKGDAALDLRGKVGRGKVGRGIEALRDALPPIPKFLRRAPDNGPLYPDAKPGDDA